LAGTIPALCLGQRVDQNGQPLVDAVLTIYNGGTLQLASAYQDFGLTIPQQNPMTADVTGTFPLFFLADSTYRCRVVDANGQLVLDVVMPSIGPSGGGGGGGGVDPSTIFQTGDELFRKIGGPRTGWVRQNALTIGSATSGASERANTDCQNLFSFLWQNYPNAKCPVVGGRGASAGADWTANKQITLPDMRGRGVAGVDGMGNVRANVIPDTNVTSAGDTGDTGAASGGEANHVLLLTEAPAHTHVIIDPGHSHGVTDPGHVHSISDPGHAHGVSDPGHSHGTQNYVTGYTAGFGVNNASGGAALAVSSGTNAAGTGISINSAATGVSVQSHATGITNQSAATGITNQSAGGGAQHNNMAPFVLGYWYLKL